jgi:cyanophycinase
MRAMMTLSMLLGFCSVSGAQCCSRFAVAQSLATLSSAGASASTSFVLETAPEVTPAIDRGAAVEANMDARAGLASETEGVKDVLLRGALLLCGGGPLPDSLLHDFFELGRAEEGCLVIIPSASGRADAGDFSRAVALWSGFKWGRVEVVHAADRKQAERDPNLLEPLKRATAVWISGGDQRRLAERYLGTPVEQEILSVVSRGGVVGGTSAGSAIASRVMITGGNTTPSIGDGLDLLPGSIIDQHFSQRRRFGRLATAVKQFPDRVGIGIDECTGLLVAHDQARVVGEGAVYVYNRSTDATAEPEPVKYVSGAAFNLTALPLQR